LTEATSVVLYLAPGSQRSPFHDAFVETLERQGFRHGSSVDLRWIFARGEEDPGKLNQLVGDAVRQTQPRVIVTASTPLTEAAKAAAPETPIVMTIAGSPVHTGLVSDIKQPGGNVTGATSQSHDLSHKQIEELRKQVRNLAAVAIIWNPNNPAKRIEYDEAVRAARELQVKVLNEADAALKPRLEVRSDGADFGDAFRAARDGGANGVLVFGDPLTVRNREAIAAAGRDGPPAIYESSDFVDAGGFMAYGPDRRQLYREAAQIVARVLKGEHPRGIPVHAPRFELKINQALGADFRSKGLL